MSTKIHINMLSWWISLEEIQQNFIVYQNLRTFLSYQRNFMAVKVYNLAFQSFFKLDIWVSPFDKEKPLLRYKQVNTINSTIRFFSLWEFTATNGKIRVELTQQKTNNSVQLIWLKGKDKSFTCVSCIVLFNSFAVLISHICSVAN